MLRKFRNDDEVITPPVRRFFCEFSYELFVCIPIVLCFSDGYGGLGSIGTVVMTKGTHIWYRRGMKAYAWDSDKNAQLIRERGISFEDIVVNIYLGKEVDIYDHPNQNRYPGRRISVVIVEDYAFLVPQVENAGEIFLKKVIPSRKATKKYLGDKDD